MNRAWIRRGAVLVVAGACALAASGCSSSTSNNAAATATYKDAAGTHTVSVSTSDLLDQVSALQQRPAVRASLQAAGFPTGNSQDTTSAGLTAYWLTQMIDQSIYDSVFDRQHLKISDADAAAAKQELPKQFPDGVFNQFPTALQNKLLDGAARKSAIAASKAFLDPKDCKSNRLISFIAVDTQAKANAAYQQIKNGKAFADVARTSSLSSTGQVGGVFGCYFANTLPAELDAAAKAVPVGTVTVPIPTSQGVFILYVQDFRSFAADPSATATLGLLATASMNARVASKSDVKVNPRFGTWGQVQTQQGVNESVIPPTVPDPRSDGATTTTLPAQQLVPQGG